MERQEERTIAGERHPKESSGSGGVVGAVACAGRQVEQASEMSAAGTCPAGKLIEPGPSAPAKNTSLANKLVNPVSASDTPAMQSSTGGALFEDECGDSVADSSTPPALSSSNVSTAGILAENVPPPGERGDALDSVTAVGAAPPAAERTDPSAIGTATEDMPPADEEMNRSAAGVLVHCTSPANEPVDMSAAGTLLAKSVPLEKAEANNTKTDAGVPATSSATGSEPKTQLRVQGVPASSDLHMYETVPPEDSSLHMGEELGNHVGAPAQPLEESEHVLGADQATSECAALPGVAAQNGLEGSGEAEPRRSSCARRPLVRIRSPGPDPGPDSGSDSGPEAAAAKVPRAADWKKRLRLDRIPPEMLVLAADYLDAPDSVQSRPPRMERMEFSNGSSVPLEEEKAAAKRLTREDEFRMHCRLQSPVKDEGSPLMYDCAHCSFRTSRPDNLVRHKKTDCPHVKDFFSWDNNNFKEATQTPRKRALSPTAHGDGGNEEAVQHSSAKRKSLPRKLSDMGPTVPAKKESALSAPEPKRAPELLEESSEEEDEDEEEEEEGHPSTSDGTTHEKIEFSEDDVVWVEWKRLHWPALVRKVYPKSLKAKVFLIGSVGSQENILVNIKKMFDFNNAERNRCFLNEGRAGRDSALVKAAQKAEEFLRKRCLGVNINAKKFFCDGEVPFVEGPPSDASDDAYLDSELWLDCDLEPSEASGDQLEATVARIKERRKRQNEKLVQCIKDGHVNSHLLAVLNGEVPSERHKFFHSSLESERVQLKHWPWFGPIDNCSQQEEIYEFCFELLKANSSLDPNFDIASYVIEVWCPEAVMKALCCLLSVDMEKAEEILMRTVIRGRAEQDGRRPDLLALPLTAEAVEQETERLRNEYRDLGIEDEVLDALNF